MLDIFWGGYMFHPAALDYSGDTCRNGCAYCFANINKAEREGNLQGAINTLYKKEPTTYMDMVLREGYPICISNRSDGFAERNLKDTGALFTHLAEIKNGIFIQTKGRACLQEMLTPLGAHRTVVYITITTLQNDISKIIEPNAPLPSERLAMARSLHAAGYLILIAVNPCNEAWMPRQDLEALATEMKHSGLNHICLEMLDLKRKRLASLGANRKKRLLNAVDTLGPKNRDYVRECTQYLISQGLSVAKKGMPFKTGFFEDVAAKLGGRTMPVLQDFINHCFDTYGSAGTLFSFREFEKFMSRNRPIFRQYIEQNTLRGFLLRSGFDTWKGNQQIHSHHELLRVVWNDPMHKMGIRNHSLFRAIGKDGEPTLDEEGNVQLYFDGEPHFGGRKEVIEL